VKTVYLSLGSNIGDRERNLCRALSLLAGPHTRVARVSSVYETEPMENRNQPHFLNIVVEVETSLFPMQMLRRVAKIEHELGRKRTVPKGPRTIDIDILTYERFRIDMPQLTVPHPRMDQRRFVLEPLAELAPDLVHPAIRQTVRELLAGVREQSVRNVGKLHWEKDGN
jgi:2-amino-4-hydroxy-6-hydroxymethyldihydropteridine diphosphokinase